LTFDGIFYTVLESIGRHHLPPFRFPDAREILTPYLDQARRREIVRQAEAEREARRASGVGWSGMVAATASPPRSDGELQEEAQAALASSQAFAASPRGRYLSSLSALEAHGHATAAGRARAAFDRGFANPDQAACPAEIGVALAALARLETPHARAACLVLSELLVVALGAAA